MGGGGSKGSKGDEKVQYDIPILGAAQAGKSTFFKALQIAKLGGFNSDEREDWTKRMRVALIKTVLKAAVEVEDSFDLEIKEVYEALKKEEIVPTARKHEILDWMQLSLNLLKNDHVKGILKKQEDAKAYDESTVHLLSKAEIFASKDYLATEDDILRFRWKTTDCEELTYDCDQVSLRFLDCGGQRELRERWIQFANNEKGNVHMIIYVMALDGYTKVLEEDKKTNCMMESIKLLKVLANKYFKQTEICVFLNKSDLYEEVIKTKDPSSVFSKYTGGCDYDKGLEFIKSELVNVCQPLHDKVRFHLTSAIDVNQMSNVIDSLKSVFLELNVKMMTGIEY